MIHHIEILYLDLLHEINPRIAATINNCYTFDRCNINAKLSLEFIFTGSTMWIYLMSIDKSVSFVIELGNFSERKYSINFEYL